MVSCCVYCQPAKRGIVAQRVEQQFACKVIQPRAMQHNVSGGQRTDREVNILPGYLFLYFDELPKELSEYRQIDGLYYFLRYGDGTYALRGSDERFADLLLSQDGLFGRTKVYKVGQMIRISEGVFAGVEAKIVSVNRRYSRMIVEIPFTHAPVRLSLEYELVEEIGKTEEGEAEEEKGVSQS